MDGQTEETDHHGGCGNTDKNKKGALTPTLIRAGKTHNVLQELAHGSPHARGAAMIQYLH